MKADVKKIARELAAQCRSEYPAEAYEEAISEFWAARMCAGDLTPAEGRELRMWLGL
jgi:hypothetical protein